VYRLSKTLIGLWPQISRQPKLFLVFVVTCVKLINRHMRSHFISERMNS